MLRWALLIYRTRTAHYMVGDIQDAHVRQDILDAKAFGLDGFALNYGMYISSIHHSGILT